MRDLSKTRLVTLISILASGLHGQEVRVSDSAELRTVLRHVSPGLKVLLNPGVYEGGLYPSEVNGTQNAPVVIQGAEPNAPPVFRDGGGQYQRWGCGSRRRRTPGIAGAKLEWWNTGMLWDCRVVLVPGLSGVVRGPQHVTSLLTYPSGSG